MVLILPLLIQGFFKMQDIRVKRYDNIVKDITNISEKCGKSAIVEPRIKVNAVLRKTDLVFIKGTIVHVIDVKIVGNDNNNLERFNKKINYCRNNNNLDNLIKDDFNVTEVRCL